MKLVIEIDDYVLDTDVDSDWVNVCRDELAESLNNAVRLDDMLQDIRQEIEEQLKEHELIGEHTLGFRRGLYYVAELIDSKIKELSE